MGGLTRRDRAGLGRGMAEIFAIFPRLAERAAVRAGALSGGEQQMLAIGRALMARPALLMMDEPSAGLAPLVVAEIGRVIRRLNAAGQTILLVEQNVRLALGLADVVYVLRRGEVAYEGPVHGAGDRAALFDRIFQLQIA